MLQCTGNMLRTILILICAAGVTHPAHGQDAGALRKRHADLSGQLADNPFGRPLYVESSTSGGAHNGELYAVIEQPFDVVASSLSHPQAWCDILKLQVNVKRCSASDDALAAMVTRKPRDPVDDAYRVDFRYELAAADNDYLHVALSAPEGPLGTRDYELRLEAAPLDSRRTFVHMSYAYSLGFMARRSAARCAITSRSRPTSSRSPRLPPSAWTGGYAIGMQPSRATRSCASRWARRNTSR